MRLRWRDLKYWPRDFQTGIKNLITWFPIIWKDRQWDHYFLLTILSKKLKLMEDYFEKGHIILDTKKVAHTMRQARICTERLRDNEYEDPFYEKLNKKWGPPELNWGEADQEGFCELDITHEHVKTEEDEEQYRKEMRKIREQTNALRKQDKEYFCKLFQKYLETWWE